MENLLNKCHFGDCIETMRGMPAGIVQTCVTSPPYFGLRDYGHDGQIGLEATPDEFIGKLVEVFREVKRVLRDDGTLWLNIGDSYNAHPGQRKDTDKAGNKQQSVRGATAAPSRSVEGIKAKDLIGIPWMLAFALRADGWYLRQDIIWNKPNVMPESVLDRCTRSHEYIFLLSKNNKYYFDNNAIKEETVDSLSKRNKRSVWTIPTKPYKGAHFATFPTALIEPCILAGSQVGSIVLDPFFGSGTTGESAISLNRNFIGCELNTDYKSLQDKRLAQVN